VIGSASLHDNVLHDLAERTHLIMASVEYRLAPEHKLPAGADDCLDAAMYLLSAEAKEKFGHTLRFIGGESAGAYLTVQTTLRLRDEKGVDVRKALAGIVPTYGIYDLSLLPSARAARASTSSFPAERENFMWLALPSDVFGSLEHIKQPSWSPLYNADFQNLPPATFGVGAEDPLLDDNILMATKWELAGNEAELIIYPGSPHGYLVVNLDVTSEAISDIVDFVERCSK
jgi:acetyl esterase